jgi:ABC-type dipeptide/oligopeptide/nickel transport system ATPase component
MAQRVVVAMGLICDPEIILADEPTAGLDVTIQAQVLDLIEQMVRGNSDRALLLATRDLGIVARFCDRVAILDRGQVSEQRSVVDFFTSPQTDSGAELIRASRGF